MHRPYYNWDYDRPTQPPPVPGTRLTPAVRGLLWTTIGMFVFQLLADRLSQGGFSRAFGLSLPGLSSGRLWQLFTYMFLHDGRWWMHVAFNMMALSFLGPEVERRTGTRHFLVLYFLSGILGGLGWILLIPHGLCIGASGAVMGVVGSFAALFPNRRLMLIFFPFVTFKAWVLTLGILGIELLMLLGRPDSRIAHSVHLAGAVAGAVYVLTVFRRDLLQKLFRSRSSRPARRHPSGLRAEELDAILDKISREGMGALTRREREALERASRENRRR
jgi:membrane associated rhomboid family serine protease